MADAQIAIIDGDQTQVVLAPGENPAIVTSIPGPQGPAGAGVPLGGTTNQVLFKQSGTNYDTAWGPITSAMIGDLEIVNADVSASAAIAGTKISPNFGSQNVTTTGTITAASFIPTSSTAPTNGLYLSATNSVALSTNGTGRLFIDASGNVSINANATINNSKLLVAGVTGNAPVTIQGSVGQSAAIALHNNNATTNRFIIGQGYASGSDNIGFLVNSANEALVLGTNSAERLRITSAGLVGIATSAPQELLHIGGATNKQLRIDTGSSPVYIGGFSGQLNLAANRRTVDGSIIDSTRSSAFISVVSNTGPSSITFATASTVNTAPTVQAVIDGSGRVGIGTTSPLFPLDVNGVIYTRGRGSTFGVLFDDWRIYNSTAPGALVFDNGSERARIDSSGRLGIGTSSPNYLITANSSTAISALQFINSSTGSTASDGFLVYNNGLNAILSNEEAGDLRLQTSGQQRLTIDSSGRVGIGTTSPGYVLDVGGAGQAVPTINCFGPAVDNNWAGGIRFASNNGTTVNSKIQASTSGLFFEYGGAERARIDSSGRLLVGTSSARSTLSFASVAPSIQVAGNTTSSSSLLLHKFGADANACKLILLKNRGANADSNGGLSVDDPLGVISFEATDGFGGSTLIGAEIGAYAEAGHGSANDDGPTRLVFSTTADGAASPTERMRINSAGYLKASNTGTYVASANNTHEFNNDQNGISSLRVHASSATYNNNVLYASCARTTTNGSLYLIFAANGNASGQFAVLDSGNAQNTNNSYGAISDLKLKENIVDANSQWDDLKALQVRNYNFKEGQTHTQIGLIAQEVELVSPGLVNESPDRDAEGNDLGTVTKSVNYSVLYMKAVKALQEAMERIETLEARLDAANL